MTETLLTMAEAAAAAFKMRPTSVCTQPGAYACWVASPLPKVTKRQLVPQMWMYRNELVLVGLTWMLWVTLDPMTGWRVYRKGDVPDEDRFALEDLMARPDTGWAAIWNAYNADAAKARAWPYSRKIAGVNYTQADKNKKAGPKQPLPDGTKRARCPKGFRRQGEECVAK